MRFGQSPAQSHHLDLFRCRGFDRNLIVHRPYLPRITAMAINRATAEDRSSGSTGFTPVAFPIAITLPCEVMPMQMEVSFIRTILNDQQWERIAPELPRRDGKK